MYTDPILQAYVDLIKAKNGELKTFFFGEPTRVPVSKLPCVMIAKTGTEVTKLTNAEDEHAVGISITIIADIRKELSTGENDASIVEGVSKLYDLMEGRNADFTLKATSVLNILRTNILVSSTSQLRTDLRTVTRVSYGETLNNRNPEEWTIQARLDFVATFNQVR